MQESTGVIHEGGAQRYLAMGLRIVAIFAIITGLMDVVMGTGVLATLGSQISSEAAADPALDSQFRFLSATWFGYGLALYWVARDIAARLPVLHILAAAMFVGGLGRLISIAVNGAPPPAMYLFLAIELAGPVAAVLLARRYATSRAAA